ncbi:MAG TPA: hypothetical protein P5305_19290 [Rubrivivax sp.]|nr:hypothetical protein [Rubrivivax sp.]HRY90033.1 hypothetical protein [Rubrivivax sp.]
MVLMPIVELHVTGMSIHMQPAMIAASVTGAVGHHRSRSVVHRIR